MRKEISGGKIEENREETEKKEPIPAGVAERG